MFTTFNVLFYLKKRNSNQTGPVPISLRIGVNGQRTEVSVGREWEASRWNSHAGRANGTKEDARALNAFLHSLQAKLSGCHPLLMEAGKEITADNLRNMLTGSERIHFASAMTLLGYRDGTDYHEGVSYLDLVSFIQQRGRNVKENLKELWRRVIFNIMVKNTDDHLRNHGFLLKSDGWELSPAYDMNPVPGGTGLTLNISENDNSLDLNLALEVAHHFRITQPEASSLIRDMKKNVVKWKDIALKYNLPNREREAMSEAFYSE